MTNPQPNLPPTKISARRQLGIKRASHLAFIRSLYGQLPHQTMANIAKCRKCKAHCYKIIKVEQYSLSAKQSKNKVKITQFNALLRSIIRLKGRGL